jgi:hypothetical protein
MHGQPSLAVPRGVEVLKADIVRDNQENRYACDHLPITAVQKHAIEEWPDEVGGMADLGGPRLASILRPRSFLTGGRDRP